MDQEKIWDYFQNNDEVADVFTHSKSRYEAIAKKIAPNSKVLNIGIGIGGLEAILLQKNVDVYCLDPGQTVVDRIRDAHDLGGKAKVGFSQAIPFESGYFDVVVMTEVLEHLSDEAIEKTLAEINRVLKLRGRFIGTVPADEILLENRVVCPCCGEVFHRWGHIQSFNRERLVKMLELNFSQVQVVRHFFGNMQALNIKGRIGLVVKMMLVSFGIKGSGETFLFVAAHP